MKILKYINKLLPILKNKSDKKKFKNILVVSNTGLGDTILGTPAIKSLRLSFPELHITFMINKKMYPLFDGFKYVDEFILYSTGFINQVKIINQLRKKRIDTIFLFHSNGPEDIFFSILSGANNILKMTDNVNHEYKHIFLNELSSKKQHVIEKKLDLVRIYEPSIIDKTMEISHFFNGKLYPLLSKKTTEKLIGFQVGAQDTYKMWSIEKFITLANMLCEKDKEVKIVLFGATQLEKKLTQQLLLEVKHKDKIINMCCKTLIEELPLIINNLDLLVTNDTGTLHLSIALKIPTVSLFGPTDSQEFGPYQDLEIHSIIQKDGFFVNNQPKKLRTQDGMKLIAVDEVMDIIKTKIKGGNSL